MLSDSMKCLNAQTVSLVGAIAASSRCYYTSTSRPRHISNLRCMGSEEQVEQCSYNVNEMGYYFSTCSYFGQVVCQPVEGGTLAIM